MNRGKRILALLSKNQQASSYSINQYLPEVPLDVSSPGYSIENLPIEFEDGILFGDVSISTCNNTAVNNGQLDFQVETTPKRIKNSIENVNREYAAEMKEDKDTSNKTDPDYDVLNDSQENEESDREVVNEGNNKINHNEDSVSEPNGPKERTKKIDLDKSKWKRNENKIKRMKGEEYIGFTRKNKKWKHNKIREERKIKERCNEKHCKKTKVYLCNKVTEENRQQIFKKFWKDLTWDQKKNVCY